MLFFVNGITFNVNVNFNINDNFNVIELNYMNFNVTIILCQC